MSNLFTGYVVKRHRIVPIEIHRSEDGYYTAYVDEELADEVKYTRDPIEFAESFEKEVGGYFIERLPRNDEGGTDIYEVLEV